MRDRLNYYLRNVDWKFALACLAVVVMVVVARRFV
jgi:hypothetical protein